MVFPPLFQNASQLQLAVTVHVIPTHINVMHISLLHINATAIFVKRSPVCVGGLNERRILLFSNLPALSQLAFLAFSLAHPLLRLLLLSDLLLRDLCPQ